MMLIAAVGTSNQRDWVRLRCHGQSCLYCQRIEEVGSPLVASPSRKRYAASRERRGGCATVSAARGLGQPVISELTLTSLSPSLSLSTFRSVSRRRVARRQRRSAWRGSGGKAKFRSSTTTTSVPRANFTLLALARSLASEDPNEWEAFPFVISPLIARRVTAFSIDR